MDTSRVVEIGKDSILVLSWRIKPQPWRGMLEAQIEGSFVENHTKAEPISIVVTFPCSYPSDASLVTKPGCGVLG